MSANPNYIRTYEEIDLAALKEAGEGTNDNIIYFCPFCEDKRGKADELGKLYYSTVKQSGLCFKCNTVVFPSLIDNDAIADTQLSQSIRHVLQLDGSSSCHPPPKMAFNFDGITVEGLRYLRARNPYLVSLVEELGLKMWSGSRQGIVIPFIYRDYVARFQVRFMDKNKENKYYTSPGKDKLVYSPRHILSTFKLSGSEPTITICEGIFDSIALQIIGYPNPLAVLGSSLTNYQLCLIRKLAPEYVFIAMDNWDISSAIKSNLKAVRSVENTRIIDFDGLDPEEHLRATFKENTKSYTENLIEWKRLMK